MKESQKGENGMGRKNRRRTVKRSLGFRPEKYIHHPAMVRRTPHVKDVRRGEIWFAELGMHPGTTVEEGCRPVIVISNDTANTRSESVAVIPMTSKMKKYYLPSHLPIYKEDLTDTDPGRPFKDCMLLAEQVTTISRSAFQHRLGRIRDAEKMSAIENVLMIHLGITDNCSASSEGGEDAECPRALTDVSGEEENA